MLNQVFNSNYSLYLNKLSKFYNYDNQLIYDSCYYYSLSLGINCYF